FRRIAVRVQANFRPLQKLKPRLAFNGRTQKIQLTSPGREIQIVNPNASSRAVRPITFIVPRKMNPHDNFRSSMKKHPCLALARSGLLLFYFIVCGVGSLLALPGDSHWDRQFGLPGTTNRVFALRFHGDKLYASGYATGTGGLLSTNTGVDTFDGTNWITAL